MGVAATICNYCNRKGGKNRKEEGKLKGLVKREE